MNRKLRVSACPFHSSLFPSAPRFGVDVVQIFCFADVQVAAHTDKPPAFVAAASIRWIASF